MPFIGPNPDGHFPFGHKPVGPSNGAHAQKHGPNATGSLGFADTLPPNCLQQPHSDQFVSSQAQDALHPDWVSFKEHFITDALDPTHKKPHRT